MDRTNSIFRIALALAIASLVIVSSFMPQIAYADTETRAVSGEGSVNTLVYSSYNGAGDYTVLNDDNNLTYFLGNSYGTGYKDKTWNIQDTAITGVITNVRLSVIAESSLSFGMKLQTYISSTSYYGSIETLTSSWVTYTKDWATNPATGSAWTISQLNNAEFGVALSTSASTNYAFITKIYLTITYEANAPPVLTTSAASGISYNGTHYATLNGEITNIYGLDADYRGFCYGTTSNSTAPSSGEIPPASYTSNITQTGTYGTGTFSQLITGLAQDTTYYFRAYAHNSEGWGYGDELSFTTLDDPSISTLAASNVASTTARLNASVVDDGGEACTVEFAYADTTLGPFTTYADISSNGTTIAATGTWTTGQSPYASIAGLSIGTGYTFMPSITNSVSTQYGSQLTFTTETGVNVPTELNGIPTATTISLQWVIGAGSTNTRIQYKTGSYPTATGDGTTAYFDNMNSVIVENLTSGTTYYFKAWGESGGFYSTANVTLMITTLASVSAATPLPTPATPAEWYQTPDYTQMSDLPFYGIVNWWADTWSIPRATVWSMLGLFGAMCGGVFIFFLSKGKTLLADIVVIILLLFTTFMGLTQMWFVMPFAIIAIAAIILGERL